MVGPPLKLLHRKALSFPSLGVDTRCEEGPHPSQGPDTWVLPGVSDQPGDEAALQDEDPEHITTTLLELGQLHSHRLVLLPYLQKGHKS